MGCREFGAKMDVPAAQGPVNDKEIEQEGAEEEEEEIDEWFVSDTDGSISGPFPTAHLVTLLQSGKYTTTELRIAKDPDQEFGLVCDVLPEFTAALNEHLAQQKQLAEEEKGNESEDNEKSTTTPTPVVVAAHAPVRALPNTWYYVDMQGKEHGPFDTETMRSWYTTNCFPPIILVRRSTETKPYPLFSTVCEFTLDPVSGTPLTPMTPAPPLPIVNVAPEPPVVPAQTNVKEESDGLLWFYVDMNNAEQGPFPTSQMRLWYCHKMLPEEVKVRIVSKTAPNEDDGTRRKNRHKPITSFLHSLFGATQEKIAPPPKTEEEFDLREKEPDPYMSLGHFNSRTGMMEMETKGYWEQKGLANDRAGRQLQHFFDFDRWQDEKNRLVQAKRRKAQKSSE
eukprot:c6227_g1_i1.p1 GENE.c6227_g1_i1~~c6227_g1_i1.p1  ORF type:complete len:395 (+),score=107.05 c6227_g1_i1:3-1187(+)